MSSSGKTIRLLLVLIFVFAVIWMWRRSSAKARPDEVAIITQIKQLHELATVRYSVQRVVGVREPKVPIGEESILLMVEGHATAGIDLQQLNRDRVRLVQPDSILVDLPTPRLLDVSLNEKQTRVWDRQITWWTPWVPYSPDLEHRARLKAIDDVRQAALDMGIISQARRNAETAIRELMGLAGLQTSFRKIPS